MKLLYIISKKYLPFRNVYKIYTKGFLVRLLIRFTEAGLLWYNKKANITPKKDSKPGRDLTNKGKLNSASTIKILSGFMNKEEAKTSFPNPTNKSENKNPKNILNKDRVNKDIITNTLDS